MIELVINTESKASEAELGGRYDHLLAMVLDQLSSFKPTQWRLPFRQTSVHYTQIRAAL